VDGFTLIADGNRRAILDSLRTRECDVGTLTELLSLPQSLVSKHLRVLRDAGAVTSAVVGRRRVYRLGIDLLPDVLAWVTPYHDMWAGALNRLEHALDDEEDDA
jgi:DNA-binding transcriptional ArsR family regulator